MEVCPKAGIFFPKSQPCPWVPSQSTEAQPSQINELVQGPLRGTQRGGGPFLGTPFEHTPAQVVTGAEDATAKVVQIETGKARLWWIPPMDFPKYSKQRRVFRKPGSPIPPPPPPTPSPQHFQLPDSRTGGEASGRIWGIRPDSARCWRLCRGTSTRWRPWRAEPQNGGVLVWTRGPFLR